ncbi:MAG TPA: hypothetical protein VGT04_13125 [Acidobacteriaceae bacterium]|nr:hypothetical protein [Acidobacteriaceae bacterium]
MRKALAILAAAGLMLAAGCHVQVDKNSNGKDKNVKIETPLGGLHVRSGSTNAADVGLPVYPGAVIAPDKDGDKSADVHMGFGRWQIRVKVVNYESSDPQDKVVAFYKNALGRYGTVIECQADKPIGSPAVTPEGLGCAGKTKAGHVDISDNLSLRAGSEHHQHIFSIEKNDSSATRFALLELQLPSGSDQDDSKSE